MKFALLMIMCSYVAGECMAPVPMDTYYNDMYSCMNAGYQHSLDKSIEVGEEQINEYRIYMKFICVETNVIVPPGKPT
tara:strand:+ start:524 stop:757 length:234 start_codon:yes stop_codon:yes gene_type:complete